MPPRARKALDAELAERRAKLVKMRALGHSWEACATKLGYADRAHACKDFGRALDERKKELALTIDQYRQQQLENLIHIREVAAEVMRKRHLLVQSGRVVTVGVEGEDGVEEKPLYDDGPTLAAIDRIAKIDAQIAQLLGLNAPTRIEAEGELKVTVEGVDVEDLK